jgi:HTH-type transcriptional regulator, sugar sensing transcriptional regulator
MKLENALLSFGLNQNQARIYLACLELGTTSAYKISKKVELPRSTCYEALERLFKENLVSVVRKKSIRYYTAESPKTLIKKSQDKIDVIEKLLPEFNALFGEAKTLPNTRLYQGKGGMEIIINEWMNEAKEILTFGSADNFFEKLGDVWPKYLKKRLAKKIYARTIFGDTPKARERQRLGQEQLRSVRILPELNNEVAGIFVLWNDKIAMFSFKKEMVGLVIESAILAKTFKVIFEALWNRLGK